MTTLTALKTAIDTPEMHSLVSAYLMQRALTEITREKVDAVYSGILNDYPAYDTLCKTGKRITSHDKLYLCQDDALCATIYDEADKRLKSAGIKPKDMPHDYCPALVAESDLSDIENMLVEVSGKPMGVTPANLLCTGLDKYHKWVDLVVGAVVNLPTFKPPKFQHAQPKAR